ncbi:hypothetical protein NSU_4517 [Novosphingobium pentaromativorans US6-1]|uniref:Uncharacterized protein n=1 Tax=Novosphingobium pentaromativorans US6-1 TaxID=1088721 RepID=G6EJJ6_9SPHN|nr:hypothetical protein NSU_4517 [Novosphingobium pentaromativorans US6-1]
MFSWRLLLSRRDEAQFVNFCVVLACLRRSEPPTLLLPPIDLS